MNEELPSRRYTCACGFKGRRNNSAEARKRPPICPSCTRYASKNEPLLNRIIELEAEVNLWRNRHSELLMKLNPIELDLFP